MINYYFNRVSRDIREYIKYPFWLLKKQEGPDNHIYKRKRIKNISRENNLNSFIETGTFYGQMVAAVNECFSRVLSVELFDKLFLLNQEAFKNDSKIKIYHGDSASMLGKMIDEVSDNVLFWLDGHYSGEGTGIGIQVSPIMYELDIIGGKNLHNICILIDDVRLFTGEDGYPTLEQTVNKIKSMYKNCNLYIDRDCLVAIIKL